MFLTLGKLDFVYFDQYYYCTHAPNVPKCSPNSDGVSSFQHLLSKPVQRVTLWLVAVFTCGANILVILGRFTARDENQALSFVVRNLAVSDFLMGVYLIVIAYEDIKFRGTYHNYAHQWMSSVTCTAIGITAMISSEVFIVSISDTWATTELCLVYPADIQCNLDEDVFSLSHQVHKLVYYDVLDSLRSN
ncbi:G-protein coupled receptor activity protein [Homalodisca vitripennis]|nr:G-protein coupled receptor activity protein [Homalodisca vitripennis]